MLTEAFLHSLTGARIASGKRRRGSMVGERRSTRRGRSIEFADYRNYTPGDDPRRVDWNVYARHERPYIKLFEDEEDTLVHVLLDISPSMRWRAEGESESYKMTRATEAALAIAFVALAGGDKLVVSLSSGASFGPRRGAAAMAAFVRFTELELARVHGGDAEALSLNVWFRRHAGMARPGVCFVVSDLLDETGYQEGLGMLAGARLEINALHTLCRDELAPTFTGDLRMKDAETAKTQDLSLDDITLRQYQERLQTFTAEAASFCRKRGGRYHLADTSLTVEEIVSRDLRREGWIV